MEDFRTETPKPLAQLIEVLEHPEERILPLLHKPQNSEDRKARQRTQSDIVHAIKYLFRGIEENALKYHRIYNDQPLNGDATDNNAVDDPPPISGLDELYIPDWSPADESKDENETPLDVETIWGQVELQSNALHKILKKSIKRLAKAPEKIVILDMDQIMSSDDESEDNENNNEEASKVDEDGNADGMDDEDARRIRVRMERAMEDAESDEDELEDEEEENALSETNETSQPTEKKEDLYDPVAEDMNDGFFDLNDMEDYADEEEDYLPREAYGETAEEKKIKTKLQEKNQKSFHQMQRDGDLRDRFDSEDEDDEEGLDELYEENAKTVKRKKYRDDEDIDALYSLYQPANDSDSEAEDAANLTAAEFFGQPSRKHMLRYDTRKVKEEIMGDDDSWGEYDFDKQGKDSKARIDEDGDGDGDGDDSVENRSEDGGYDDGEKSEKQQQQPKEKTANKKVDNSRYGKQQEKLRKQTEELETELLAEKPWQMKGETKSTARPVDSLLEGTPEFEMASKQAPIITIEHTVNIEDAIKKRILAEDWDDVVPRELPDVGWHKQRGELPEVSQEKSKLGLGELYEREYLKKAVGYDKDAEEKKSEEDKAKDEMKQLFASLCSKLDGLSNYHFAPRPIADEVEVRPASTPAIAMEEVLPLHVNDARVVAPEEVYATKRGREGVLRGETEMDQQERKRLRQSKKSARRKARKEKLADEKLVSRLEPGLGLNNPYEKRKAREELAMARSRGKVTTGEQDTSGKYGSSGTFFQRLQADAQKTVHGQSLGMDEEPKKKSKPKSSALKL